MIDHNKKIVYIHIPKCAGSSVKFWLKHVCDKKAVSRGGHPTYEYYSNKYNIEEYYKFTIVRNPFDRLVSAYNYLKRGGRGGKHDTRASEELKTYNFNQFVEKIELLKQKYIHFQSQMHFIGNVKHFNHVGRLEDLNQTVTTLVSDLSIDTPLIFPHENKQQHGQYRLYYDQETIDIVSRVYKHDIDTLNYDY